MQNDIFLILSRIVWKSLYIELMLFICCMKTTIRDYYETH